MGNLFLIGGVAAALFSGTVAPSYTVIPPDEQITAVFDVVSVVGSGCPAGTSTITVSPDNTSATVTFDRYMALIGVGAKATDFRKTCQIALQMHAPAGFTYAVLQADYRGYASLAPGANAQFKTSYSFQGTAPTAVNSHGWNGPMDEGWASSDVSDVTSLNWAPCGENRYLNINTELRVNAGASDTKTTTSTMLMADQTVPPKLIWKRCD